MLMALSTGPTPYHLCLLILPAALTLDALLAEGRRRQAVVLIALYGTICLPWTEWAPHHADGWRMFLASPRVYPLLGLPFFLYAILGSLPAVQERLRTHRGEMWAFGGMFILLAAMGSLQLYHHLQGQFDSYSRRLFSLPASVLKGEPAMSAQGLYFTRMPGHAASFEAWMWAGGGFTALPPAEDEFHPAAAPGLAEVWVELAGPVSNIVRFSNHSGALTSASRIEVGNGEQPSVSPDGAWLAFIRENQGRGALWLKGLAEGSTSTDRPEHEVVDSAFDVWEAAFEPGDKRIIFTAALTGQPELYSLDLTTARIAPMSISGPARYPAFSPNGQWLAYSRCERGTWHLYVAPTVSGAPRPLTQGDCNSISPAWEANSKNLIYATDCGRGLEMTALARMTVNPGP